jgi:hypothetical protein
MQQEKLIGVLEDADGAPLSFCWQGTSYLATSRPTRWYSRKLWWEVADAAPKGSGSAILETEIWRVWAACGLDRRLFEITRTNPGGEWLVLEVS